MSFNIIVQEKYYEESRKKLQTKGKSHIIWPLRYFLTVSEQGFLYFAFTLRPTNDLADSDIYPSSYSAWCSRRWRESYKDFPVWEALKLNSCLCLQGWETTRQPFKFVFLFLLLTHAGHVIMPKGSEMSHSYPKGSMTANLLLWY